MEDEESATQILDETAQAGMSRAEQLQSYVQAAEAHLEKKQQIDGKYVDYYEAETSEDLRKIIDPLLTENFKHEEPMLWPIVKKVYIGVRGSRILDSHTIADLPGISDTNQVRVKATYEYIDWCDEIWVVAVPGASLATPPWTDCSSSMAKSTEATWLSSLPSRMKISTTSLPRTWSRGEDSWETMFS